MTILDDIASLESRLTSIISQHDAIRAERDQLIVTCQAKPNSNRTLCVQKFQTHRLSEANALAAQVGPLQDQIRTLKNSSEFLNATTEDERSRLELNRLISEAQVTVKAINTSILTFDPVGQEGRIILAQEQLTLLNSKITNWRNLLNQLSITERDVQTVNLSLIVESDRDVTTQLTTVQALALSSSPIGETIEEKVLRLTSVFGDTQVRQHLTQEEINFLDGVTPPTKINIVKLEQNFVILFDQLNLLIRKAEQLISDIKSGRFKDILIPNQTPLQSGGLETRDIETLKKAALSGLISFSIPRSVQNIKKQIEVARGNNISIVNQANIFEDLLNVVHRVTNEAASLIDNNAALKEIVKIRVRGSRPDG